MLPLLRDPWFTFRFADDRIIPRFHLEGVPRGSQVSVFKIDPESGEGQGLIASAKVGAEGWVDLLPPITMKAGKGFIAVPITHHLSLTILPDTFAVSRLAADAAVTPWATTGSLFSITRTADELSIVCLQSLQIFPIKTHPTCGYEVDDLPEGDEIIRRSKACGKFTRKHNLRTCFHPDQFVVLNSQRPEVVEASIRELEYQAEVAKWIGADVVNIHGGGAFGDKQQALTDFARVVSTGCHPGPGAG